MDVSRACNLIAPSLIAVSSCLCHCRVLHLCPESFSAWENLITFLFKQFFGCRLSSVYRNNRPLSLFDMKSLTILGLWLCQSLCVYANGLVFPYEMLYLYDAYKAEWKAAWAPGSTLHQRLAPGCRHGDGLQAAGIDDTSFVAAVAAAGLEAGICSWDEFFRYTLNDKYQQKFGLAKFAVLDPQAADLINTMNQFPNEEGSAKGGIKQGFQPLNDLLRTLPELPAGTEENFPRVLETAGDIMTDASNALQNDPRIAGWAEDATKASLWVQQLRYSDQSTYFRKWIKGIAKALNIDGPKPSWYKTVLLTGFPLAPTQKYSFEQFDVEAFLNDGNPLDQSDMNSRYSLLKTMLSYGTSKDKSLGGGNAFKHVNVISAMSYARQQAKQVSVAKCKLE